MSLLGGLDPAEFLRRHWQKSRLLVRGAFEGPLGAVSPETLAGWACEEEVDSRLVVGPDENGSWRVSHGPFSREHFARLPEERWTLLVQEMDRLVPEVAGLLECFRFVPNWRIDDVMISYAAPGGGVGPHVDNYDVFLIQGSGRRRWRIGARPIDRDPLLPGLEPGMLQDFRADEEWVLEPGDMLYLPPRIPHEGTALDACMTYSIGFRAPSHREIVGAVLQLGLETLDPALRYTDPDLALQSDPGRIGRDVLARARQIVVDLARDESLVHGAIGCQVTEPRRETGRAVPVPPHSAARLRASLQQRGCVLRRLAVARFAYIRADDGSVRLFVGGREHSLGPDLGFAAPLLCGRDRLSWKAVGPHFDREGFVDLLRELVGEGQLLVERGGRTETER